MWLSTIFWHFHSRYHINGKWGPFGIAIMNMACFGQFGTQIIYSENLDSFGLGTILKGPLVVGTI